MNDPSFFNERRPASLHNHLRIVFLGRGMGALAARLYVYLSGFCVVFAMAANVSPASFGEYSVYQSVLELGLIVATLGSSIIFSRNAIYVPPALYAGDLRRTLAIGIPLSAALIAGMLHLQHMPLGSVPFFLILTTLAFFSFNSLRLAYSRGRGASGLLNAEAGLRSSFVLAGIGLCVWAGFDINVPYLLTVNLLAVASITAAIMVFGRSAEFPSGKPILRLASQASAATYSLLMFTLRKSDLLVVAFLMPLPYLGAFKLAFLLAEAPSQFVQAFLYTRTVQMLAPCTPSGLATQLRLARSCFLLGLLLFCGLGVFLYLFGALIKFGHEARLILLCMLPYFLLRTYTVHHELLLQLHTRLRLLSCWALIEVILKAVTYCLIAWVFPAQPHYVFLGACVTELLLYEFRMRSLCGVFPLSGMFGVRPS